MVKRKSFCIDKCLNQELDISKSGYKSNPLIPLISIGLTIPKDPAKLAEKLLKLLLYY